MNVEKAGVPPLDPGFRRDDVQTETRSSRKSTVSPKERAGVRLWAATRKAETRGTVQILVAGTRVGWCGWRERAPSVEVNREIGEYEMKMNKKRSSYVVLLVLAAIIGLAGKALAGAESWNDENIKWMGYEDGLKAAKEQSKPVCLILYTSWCPHCTNYSKVFSDEKVAEKAKSFVMIRLDSDKNKEISGKYKPDGEYIPRTFFLSSDGVLDESLAEGRPQYKYFYNENEPASILAGMDRALAKLKK